MNTSTGEVRLPEHDSRLESKLDYVPKAEQSPPTVPWNENLEEINDQAELAEPTMSCPNVWGDTLCLV